MWAGTLTCLQDHKLATSRLVDWVQQGTCETFWVWATVAYWRLLADHPSDLRGRTIHLALEHCSPVILAQLRYQLINLTLIQRSQKWLHLSLSCYHRSTLWQCVLLAPVAFPGDYFFDLAALWWPTWRNTKMGILCFSVRYKALRMLAVRSWVLGWNDKAHAQLDGNTVQRYSV